MLLDLSANASIFLNMATHSVDDFEFSHWCDEFELNEDTKKALLEQGYNSYKSIRHLDEGKVKVQFKKLQPAQQCLLIEGVSLLNPPKKTSPATPQPRQEDRNEASDPVTVLQANGSLTATQVLDLLRSNPTIGATFNAGGQDPTATRQAQGEPSYFLDPFQFGRDRFVSKCRSVPDYVSSLARGDQPTTITLGGMDFISTSQKKVPHEKLTIAQYMEGALRMTRDLIIEDGANLDNIMDYISHVIQVALFAQSFTWSSVLNYDRVYRREQASLGFKWGTPSSFLMASHLQKPSQGAQPESNKKKVTAPNAKDPKSDKTVCLRFNGTNGCSLTTCNFAHVCRVCFQDHPEVQHSKAAKN